jgi:glutamate synthase (NADPH) large chain
LHATTEYNIKKCFLSSATNTDPQWNNAQPCPYFMMQNGELNSALSNAADMGSELKSQGFSGIFPGANLSDSMQFDADLANQVAMKKLGLEDAFLRLMPPLPSRLFSEEANAMLKYHRLERTPYNGPAFMVGGTGGNFIAALDVFGLRPSRHALVLRNDGGHQFHAASDEYLGFKGDVTVLSKGHLEPGGVLLITKEGEILKTKDVLDRALQNHILRGGENFTSLLSRTTVSLPEASPAYIDDVTSSTSKGLLSGPQQSSLNRLLYSAGWDHESIEQVVRPMALNGSEPIAAMGNDINPLPQREYYGHISYFFHQLFAQVSAPPLDSIKERDRFNLSTSLGPLLGATNSASKVLSISSPYLKVGQLGAIINNTEVLAKVLDTTFAVGPTCSAEEANTLLSQAITRLVSQAATTVRSEQTGILILSDKGLTDTRMLIPDAIAVAAVRQHLEAENLIRKASIVIDTYQVNGPHHASLLLALGAKAVYPRGAYKKVGDLFGHDDPVRLEIFRSNYNYALVKCLLKTMGKMGITDVNNYINGKLVAALGINLSTDDCTLPAKLVHIEPSLANIFPGIYSPMKGIDLKQIAGLMMERRELVIDKGNDFSRLPRSGFYMPEKKGEI